MNSAMRIMEMMRMRMKKRGTARSMTTTQKQRERRGRIGRAGEGGVPNERKNDESTTII